jgi:hypothetical protein
MERGESYRARRGEQFRLLTPWMCAGLVAGVEAWQKPFGVAVFVIACAIAVLLVILAGIDMWQAPSGQGRIQATVKRQEVFQATGVPTPSMGAPVSPVD